ncbi:hypothetical protein MMPV_003073 [Pyropia vietnamensis]
MAWCVLNVWTGRRRGGFGGGEEWRCVDWAGQNVDLYNRFRDAPGMAVARGVDRSLVHARHADACGSTAKPVESAKTAAMSMAPQERLAELVIEVGVDAVAALGEVEDTSGKDGGGN